MMVEGIKVSISRASRLPSVRTSHALFVFHGRDLFPGTDMSENVRFLAGTAEIYVASTECAPLSGCPVRDDAEGGGWDSAI